MINEIEDDASITLTINMSFSVSLSDPDEAMERLRKLAEALINTLPPKNTEKVLEKIYEAMGIIAEQSL